MTSVTCSVAGLGNRQECKLRISSLLKEYSHYTTSLRRSENQMIPKTVSKPNWSVYMYPV